MSASFQFLLATIALGWAWSGAESAQPPLSAVERSIRNTPELDWRLSTVDQVLDAVGEIADGPLALAQRLAHAGDLVGAADAAARAVLEEQEPLNRLRAMRLRAQWIQADRPAEAALLLEAHEWMVEAYSAADPAEESVRARERLSGGVSRATLLHREGRTFDALQVLRGLYDADDVLMPTTATRAMLRLQGADLLRRLGQPAEADRERARAVDELGTRPAELRIRTRALWRSCEDLVRDGAGARAFEECAARMFADPFVRGTPAEAEYRLLVARHIADDPRRSAQQRRRDVFDFTNESIATMNGQLAETLASIDRSPAPEAKKAMDREWLMLTRANLYWIRLSAAKALLAPGEIVALADGFLLEFPDSSFADNAQAVRDEFAAKLDPGAPGQR